MGAACCGHHENEAEQKVNASYRRALWLVLAINAAMFAVEIGAGVAAGSASLQADALDFLGDAGNYAISLFVVGMALRYRATAALVKARRWGCSPLGSLESPSGTQFTARCPEPSQWGRSALPLFWQMPLRSVCCGHIESGDANMRSAWICTRNDVLGNLAVLLAAAGVFGTGSGWPDIVVAGIMAALALQGAVTVIRQSVGELNTSRALSPAE